MDTLAYMRALVRREYRDPLVVQTAHSIVPPGSSAETAAALIRQWLELHTSFQRDPADLELIYAPTNQLTTIRTGGTSSGDCDDVAVLGAALALAVGLRARFIVVGRSNFEHVFTVVGDGRQYFELDITRPNQTVPRELQTNVFTVEV